MTVDPKISKLATALHHLGIVQNILDDIGELHASQKVDEIVHILHRELDKQPCLMEPTPQIFREG